MLAAARAAGRQVLLEPEGLALARELGLAVPVHRLVAGLDEARELDLAPFGPHGLVVKICAAQVVHKGVAGGVLVVPCARAALLEAVATLESRFATVERAGVLVCERVPHEPSLGRELLLGLRWTDDFGPVVTLAPGGVHAELLAQVVGERLGPAIVSPALPGREALQRALRGRLLMEALGPSDAGGAPPSRCDRGVGAEGGSGGSSQPPGQPLVLELAERALAFAARALPHELEELEFNPVVLTARGPVALDAFGRLAGPRPRPAPPRPLHRLAQLLRPRSLAILGVSERANPGRIILENVLAAGFPPGQLTVVKPGRESLAGCRCVPDLASLPGPVDLLVVAVSAAQVPAVLEDVVEHGRAAAVILIPGGLGERAGSEVAAERVRSLLAASRSREDGGPVVVGGNCLGVRSLPGRYDTLFIPRHKLPPPGERPAPLAIVSQSGAFAVALVSGLPFAPRTVVTIGNQLDLTVGDLLTHLEHEPGLEVYACYVEGFAPGDGLRWLQAAARISASGRPVILYRAGRTPQGARASASHTASVAGAFAVTRELARAAGVVVARTLDEFHDLVRLFTLLRGRCPAGGRLGALSNAGFECVAMADSLGPFTLAALEPATVAALDALLGRSDLASIVAATNPLDVTPILGDEAFAEAARIVLGDEGVDLGLVGCVPLTGALQTLPAGAAHGEDLAAGEAVAERLVQLFAATSKPWAAVVDGGPLFDPLARRLERGGLPTFRRADRALRALALWAEGQRPVGAC